MQEALQHEQLLIIEPSVSTIVTEGGAVLSYSSLPLMVEVVDKMEQSSSVDNAVTTPVTLISHAPDIHCETVVEESVVNITSAEDIPATRSVELNQIEHSSIADGEVKKPKQKKSRKHKTNHQRKKETKKEHRSKKKEKRRNTKEKKGVKETSIEGLHHSSQQPQPSTVSVSEHIALNDQEGFAQLPLSTQEDHGSCSISTIPEGKLRVVETDKLENRRIEDIAFSIETEKVKEIEVRTEASQSESVQEKDNTETETSEFTTSFNKTSASMAKEEARLLRNLSRKMPTISRVASGVRISPFQTTSVNTTKPTITAAVVQQSSHSSPLPDSQHQTGSNEVLQTTRCYIRMILMCTQYHQIYTYAELSKPADRRPPGVDHKHLDQYLSEEEFLNVFGMNRDGFARLPEWKKVLFSLSRYQSLLVSNKESIR